MCLTEYNEKVFIDGIHKEGFDEGKAEGKAEERLESVKAMLISGKTAEQIADFCGYNLKFVKEVEKTIK